MSEQMVTDNPQVEANTRKDIAISAGFGAALGSIVWTFVFSPTGVLNWHDDEWIAFFGGIIIGLFFHFYLHLLQRPPEWVKRWNAKRGLPPPPELHLAPDLPHQVRLGNRVFGGFLLAVLVGLAFEVFVHVTSEKFWAALGGFLVFIPAAVVTWYWMDEKRSTQTATVGLSGGAISSLPVAVLLAVLMKPSEAPSVALGILTLYSTLGFAGGLAIDKGWASRDSFRTIVTEISSTSKSALVMLLSLFVAVLLWIILMRVFSIFFDPRYSVLIAIGWGLGFFPWFVNFTRWYLRLSWLPQSAIGRLGTPKL